MSQASLAIKEAEENQTLLEYHIPKTLFFSLHKKIKQK